MRIFVALDIDEAIRQRIATFIEGVRGFAPDARWVSPDALHITLKFVGETSPEKVEEMKIALAAVGGEPTAISFAGAGFFPTPRAARVFWIGVDAGPPLAGLAAAADAALMPLGVPREERAFSPHLTLARAGSGRPQRGPEDRTNLRFARLQQRLAEMPAPSFGTMTPQEFFLYESKLSPKGAQYTRLQRFALGSG